MCLVQAALQALYGEFRDIRGCVVLGGLNLEITHISGMNACLILHLHVQEPFAEWGAGLLHVYDNVVM